MDRGIKNEPFSLVHILYEKTKMILYEILLGLILAYLSIMVIGVITYGMLKKINNQWEALEINVERD